MSVDDLTAFEKLELQMQAIVPLVRALQAQLGEQAVNDALDRMHEDRLEAARAKAKLGAALPLSVNRAFFEEWGEGALEYEVKRDDEIGFDVDVTGCRYAKMMASLDAQDVGVRLVCSYDYASSAEIGHDLVRTQTCMGGATHCDFRISMAMETPRDDE